jgi:hypothetical protein
MRDNRVVRGERLESMGMLVFSLVPGWLIAAGFAWSLAAYPADRTVQTAACIFAAIAVLNVGSIVRNEGRWTFPVGSIPWFSGVAQMVLINRAYLDARSRAAGVPRIVVVVLAWGPWWALAGSWVLLVLYAVSAFAFG